MLYLALCRGVAGGRLVSERQLTALFWQPPTLQQGHAGCFSALAAYSLLPFPIALRVDLPHFPRTTAAGLSGCLQRAALQASCLRPLAACCILQPKQQPAGDSLLVDFRFVKRSTSRPFFTLLRSFSTPTTSGRALWNSASPEASFWKPQTTFLMFSTW